MHPSHELDTEVILAIGKAVIVIAWADGEIQDEEVECIRSILGELPHLDETDRDTLNSFLDSPIEATESDIIIEELVQLASGQNERNFAIYSLDKILNAKGIQDPREAELHKKISERLLNRETTSANTKPTNYEKSTASPSWDLGAFVQEKLEQARAALNMDSSDSLALKRITLSGLLLAHVTKADMRIEEKEVTSLQNFITELGNVSAEQASQLTRILLTHEIKSEQSVVQLCRDISSLLSVDERKKLASNVIEISNHDGFLKDTEVNRIINITACLGIEQSYFEQELQAILKTHNDAS